MTKHEERQILSDPGTHRLVREVLDLTARRDPVDAYYDVLTACDILKRRMDELLGVNSGRK